MEQKYAQGFATNTGVDKNETELVALVGRLNSSAARLDGMTSDLASAISPILRIPPPCNEAKIGGPTAIERGPQTPLGSDLTAILGRLADIETRLADLRQRSEA